MPPNRINPLAPPPRPASAPATVVDPNDELLNDVLGLSQQDDQQAMLLKQLRAPRERSGYPGSGGEALGSLINQIRDSRARKTAAEQAQANLDAQKAARAKVLRRALQPDAPDDSPSLGVPYSPEVIARAAALRKQQMPVEELMIASGDPVLAKFGELKLARRKELEQAELQRQIHAKNAPVVDEAKQDLERANAEAARALAKKRLAPPPVKPVKPEKVDSRAARLAYNKEQNMVPGFEGPALLPEEKVQLTNMIAARDRLLSTIEGIKGIYTARDLPFSNKRAQLKTKLMELKPQISATAGFPFTQGHQDMIESGIADPSHLETWINSGYLPAQLDEMSGLAKDAVEKSLAARKLTPATSPARVAGDVSLETHPQDSAAVAWAKAHPDDPRAEKILSLNGAR